MTHISNAAPGCNTWTDFPPDNSPYPESPGWKGQETSREAAIAVASSSKNMQAKVLNLLLEEAPSSLSADQIAVRLQRGPLSIRPRVSELYQLGLIEPGEERVTNESGATAMTWRISKSGGEQ